MKKKGIIITIVTLVIIGCLIGILFNKNNKKDNLIELSAKELKEKIENKDSFILVVSKEGCSHCAEYKPVFKDVLEDYDLTAYIIDLATFSKDDRSYLNEVANISGTPTTLFIEEGEEKTVLNRIVGSANSKTIKSRLKALNYIE